MFRFIRLLAVLFVLGVILPSTNHANAEESDRVAVQLYIFGAPASEPAEPLKEVLDTVKKAGYEKIQAWLDYYKTEESAETLQGLLKEYDLEMVAAYTGGVMHDNAQAEAAIETILEKAKRGAEQGLEIVVLNPAPTDEPKSDEELEIQAANLNRLGAALNELGLKLAIHQHAPEMRDGAREWYHILRNTDPDKVYFCLDTHWVLRGGQDPYQLTRDAGNRIADLHLRNSTDGTWSESFGEGDIDYRKIAKILDDIDYQGYLTVELAHEKGTEKTQSLLKDLQDSREYVKEVFGE
ncbi:MAG: sugar phosphate isomerase/epimerase [Candidatus Omnitrophica bacterium]|nr:sugar phosphate isomerase/epimerase [Candidatus Omnitrophota bacterium]